jgi:hypothetical protein
LEFIMGNVLYGSSFEADTTRGKSKGLWHDSGIEKYRRLGMGGVYDGDDFTGGGAITAVTTDADLIGVNYMGFNSSGGTHTYAATTGGVLVITEATDNEASYVRRSSWPFQISALKGDLTFEARVKVSAIADNQIGFILGLWDNVACSVVVPLSTANPPVMATTGNFVGFWGPEEDAGGVDAIYKADGVTEVVVNAAAHQFVADTYVKLGMKYRKDYQGSGVPKLEFYVNGLPKGSPKQIPDNTGTDFPADVYLNFMFGHRLGAGTSSLTSCDWWECFQKDVD